jgi:hypothetical protein
MPGYCSRLVESILFTISLFLAVANYWWPDSHREEEFGQASSSKRVHMKSSDKHQAQKGWGHAKAWGHDHAVKYFFVWFSTIPV